MRVKPCVHRPVLNSCTLENLNYQVDPYVGCGHNCHYCYVLPQAETDWRKEVLFHENIFGRLEKELAAIPPQTIYIGWHTDPYQPCETECRQTRQVLELLLARGFSASILTKSDLVLRDLDLLQPMEDSAVSFSVAFNGDEVRQLFEANTRPTEARISALRKLSAAGIRTTALICPVVPYITDVIEFVDRLAGHTEKIWIYALSILNKMDITWQNVANILDRHFPDTKGKIEAAVFDKNNPYWENLRQDLSDIQKTGRMNLSVHI